MQTISKEGNKLMHKSIFFLLFFLVSPIFLESSQSNKEPESCLGKSCLVPITFCREDRNVCLCECEHIDLKRENEYAPTEPVATTVVANNGNQNAFGALAGIVSSAQTTVQQVTNSIAVAANGPLQNILCCAKLAVHHDVRAVFVIVIIKRCDLQAL